jgi:signal recognition particle subunit SRP19
MLGSITRWGTVDLPRKCTRQRRRYEKPAAHSDSDIHLSVHTFAMSRRQPAVQIEEEFDDDTDLPLPNAPLPNTGARGPLLEEMNIDYERTTIASPSSASYSTTNTSSSAAGFGGQFSPGLDLGMGGGGGLGLAGMGSSQNRTTVNTVTDITPYKTWSCIYPIYLDAKRPYGPGQRRLSREKSVWWPLSKDIADAATKLGLKVLHEVNKSHPRDWENPGRVRVQWKVEGTGVSVNPQIKTKKQLLELISMYIHHIKPDNRPVPPYTTTALPDDASLQPTTNISSAAKGKSKATSSSISTPKPRSAVSSSHVSTQGGSEKQTKRLLPKAPHPLPALAERVSHYSPALESGMLIDAVKAGMTAQDGTGTPGAGPGGEGGDGAGAGKGQGQQGPGGKGKRKVIRVRG